MGMTPATAAWHEGGGDARPVAVALPPTVTKVRPGFSLVEVTIGVVLLEVGVLALAVAAGGIVRMTSLGGRDGGASVVAAARFEELRATACALPAGESGTVSGGGVTGLYDERWSVAGDGPARVVQLAVSYADGRRTRAALYETVIACPP